MAFVLSAFSKNPWRSIPGHCTTEPIIYHVNESPRINCPVCNAVVEVPNEATPQVPPRDASVREVRRA